jgi:hypothetical protein
MNGEVLSPMTRDTLLSFGVWADVKKLLDTDTPSTGGSNMEPEGAAGNGENEGAPEEAESASAAVWPAPSEVEGASAAAPAVQAREPSELEKAHATQLTEADECVLSMLSLMAATDALDHAPVAAAQSLLPMAVVAAPAALTTGRCQSPPPATEEETARREKRANESPGLMGLTRPRGDDLA